MERTGEGLESVFLVWLIFNDLEGAFDSTTHEMADTAKQGSHSKDTRGSLGGFQDSVLPLKIVFRCADEIKDLLDGPVDEFG